MRLIDADELKKDDEVNLWLSNDTVRTGKTLKMFSELFIEKINEQEPIQAIPIDVLDKIRDEILDNAFSVVNPKNTYEYINVIDLDSIDGILDKYKAESEDKA